MNTLTQMLRRSLNRIRNGNDHFGLCPRCGAEPMFRHYNNDHLACCDGCKVFWYAGTNVVTSYSRLVFDGVFDDEIGGPENRDAEVRRANAETKALLLTYENDEAVFCYRWVHRVADTWKAIRYRFLHGFHRVEGDDIPF